MQRDALTSTTHHAALGSDVGALPLHKLDIFAQMDACNDHVAMSRCAEPWTEVIFKSDNEGRAQVLPTLESRVPESFFVTAVHDELL